MLLFWEDLTKQLKGWGFEINPYDWCAAKKTIEGEQCIVLWHVNDIKVSHKDPKVVNDVMALFSKQYDKEVPLTISQGKVHEYLGMTIARGYDR
jgi:hypothetical protein